MQISLTTPGHPVHPTGSGLSINRQPRFSPLKLRRSGQIFIFLRLSELGGIVSNASGSALHCHKMGPNRIRSCHLSHRKRSSPRLTSEKQYGRHSVGLRCLYKQQSYTNFATLSPSPFVTFRTKFGTFLPCPKVQRRAVMSKGVVALARRPPALSQTFAGNAVRSAFGRKSHTKPQSL